MNVVSTPWPDRVLVISSVAAETDPSPNAPFREAVMHCFSGFELETAASFKLQKRRDEWLLSRYAAKRFAVELGIVEDARACVVERPVLFVDGQPTSWFVSLSHSAPYAGAALSHEPIGLDVQVVRDIAEWSSHLFLSDAEAEAMRECALPWRALHFWCAKEAAWKKHSDEYATMKQLPLRLAEERANGLRFDRVETILAGDVIVAVTV